MLEKIKRTCPGCGELKTLVEDFSTDPYTRNGYASHCKMCKKFEAEQRKRKRLGIPLLPDNRKQKGHKGLPLVSTRRPKMDLVRKNRQKIISPAKTSPISAKPEAIRAGVLDAFAESTGDFPVRTVEKLRHEWWHSFELIKDEVIDGDVIITLYTDGWSGNEDIIDALARSNFWQRWWLRSERGGIHTFKILAAAWASSLSEKK
jgi:hypothetical protein